MRTPTDPTPNLPSLAPSWGLCYGEPVALSVPPHVVSTERQPAAAPRTGVEHALGAGLRISALVALMTMLLVAAFGAGYLSASQRAVTAGLAAPTARIDGDTQPDEAAPPTTPRDLAREFEVFWEAWNVVDKRFHRQPVDRTKLVQGAIRGMLQSLGDQYSSYLDPISSRIEKTNLDGVFDGIGATVDIKNGRHTIVAPIENSPAERAGLRTGDAIVRVDGKNVANLSLQEAVTLIRGPSGTKVRLTVSRLEEPELGDFELEIIRSRIEIESVSTKLLPDAEGIGYVRLRNFGAGTKHQLERHLREFRAKRMKGVILDLRDNPGGLLPTSVDVASQFLREGRVVVTEQRNGQTAETHRAGKGGLASDMAVVVLVNKGSASASEIVAGALQDHGRATLIGERTFGKGSLQLPHDLKDGSQVRVTVALWATPNGRLIHGNGLQPDIEIKPTKDDEQAKRDVALERAIEWFTGRPRS